MLTRLRLPSLVSPLASSWVCATQTAFSIVSAFKLGRAPWILVDG
jgi:hypothetical protein